MRYREARIDRSILIDWAKPWYLWGDVGCGKTHNAWGVVNKRNADIKISMEMDEKANIFRGYHYIRLYNWVDLCNSLRNAPLNVGDDYTRVRSYIEDGVLNVKYLIIDDIGAEHRSPYTDEFLMRLVENRYTKEMYTGFTSNFDLKNLPYEKRIVSRISGLVGKNRFELRGKDRRIIL